MAENGGRGAMPSEVKCHLWENLSSLKPLTFLWVKQSFMVSVCAPLTPRGAVGHMYVQGGREGGEGARDNDGSLVTLKPILPLSAKAAYPLDGSRASHLG